jgi:dipeptidyl aminopeptidase/acylaminoacyl peptidase
MKPASYQPGKKYPLLLEIHGGPLFMWGPAKQVCGTNFNISAAWLWHVYLQSKGLRRIWP